MIPKAVNEHDECNHATAKQNFPMAGHAVKFSHPGSVNPPRILSRTLTSQKYLWKSRFLLRFAQGAGERQKCRFAESITRSTRGGSERACCRAVLKLNCQCETFRREFKKHRCRACLIVLAFASQSRFARSSGVAVAETHSTDLQSPGRRCRATLVDC